MIFVRLGQVLSIAIILFGVFGICVGVNYMLSAITSLHDGFELKTFPPPKVISQGVALVVVGTALGILSYIGDCIQQRKEKAG